MKILTKTSGFITCLTFTLPLWVCTLSQAGSGHSSSVPILDPESLAKLQKEWTLCQTKITQAKEAWNQRQIALEQNNAEKAKEEKIFEKLNQKLIENPNQIILEEKDPSNLQTHITNFFNVAKFLQQFFCEIWQESFGKELCEIPWNDPNNLAFAFPSPHSVPIILKGEYVDKEHIHCFPTKQFLPKNENINIDEEGKTYKAYVNEGGKTYEAYVTTLFGQKTLPECTKYLNDHFCKPVSELLMAVCTKITFSPLNTDSQWAKKEVLQQIFQLYAAYVHCGIAHITKPYLETSPLGEVGVLSQKDILSYANPCESLNPQPKLQDVRKNMQRIFCSLYKQISELPKDTQKWLLDLLEKTDQNGYTTENLSTYHINEKILIVSIKDYMQGMLSEKVQDYFNKTMSQEEFDQKLEKNRFRRHQMVVGTRMGFGGQMEFITTGGYVSYDPNNKCDQCLRWWNENCW